MAESDRISAQSLDTAALAKLDDLALQACDDADNLNEAMRAYTALEKLVDTGTANDSEELATSCTELSALLRLLNEALLARIDTVNGATSAVREALRQDIGSTQ